jgi:hypothetical protein
VYRPRSVSRGLAHGFLGLLLVACSGSSFEGTPDAGTHSVDAPDASSGGDGGSSGSDGDAAIDVDSGDADTTRDARADTELDADCMGLEPGCACVLGHCGPGLGCADNLCVLVPVPVADWPFSGNASDASGNGFHGVPTNEVTFSAETALFNGTDAHVDISAFGPKFKQIWGQFSLYLRFRLRIS